MVKTLNIVNCEVMVDAKRSGGDPTMFMSGNSAEAKAGVKEMLNVSVGPTLSIWATSAPHGALK
ncbi:MAG: hypothetical protein L6Q97_08990 [Thermoanaerobaculia bacterium]|nr:hypothetical protein [Thermoanaerobaculia bacterium]